MIGLGRRNPYVSLGVPFGADRDTATDAFALQARGLRHSTDDSELLRELTWALNQIDEILKEPHLALEVYRVPADPGALEADATGLLRPPPEPMDRSTDSSDRDVATVLNQARQEFIRHLRQEIADNTQLPQR